MREFAGSDAEGERAYAAVGASMAIAADDRTTWEAQAQFGPDNMDDTLSGLVDIEQLDAAGRGFHPKGGEQFQSDFAGTGPPPRR